MSFDSGSSNSAFKRPVRLACSDAAEPREGSLAGESAPGAGLSQDTKLWAPEAADEASIPDVIAWATKQFHAGKRNEAQAICMSVLGELAPVHALLGSILLSGGDASGAVTFLAAAAALQPDNADVHLAHSRALGRSGCWKEALGAAQTAISLDPKSARAHSAAGDALLQMGALEPAIACCRLATELDPQLVAAWLSLGSALGKQGRLSEATRALERAVEHNPNDVAGWSNLYLVQLEQGEPAKGQAALERALALAPDAMNLNANLLFLSNVGPDEKAEQTFEMHRSWGSRLVERAAPFRAPHENTPDPDRVLRIGYLSPDFRGPGGVATFIEPLLAHYDRTAFHVTCYSKYPHADETTAAFKAYADRWRPIAGRKVDEVAAQIRDDGIDILVDLAAYAGGIPELFARKPAPVQVTYLGYPNTTGLTTIDYRITDAMADPSGASERFHTERLVRPFASFLCYAPVEDAPAVGLPPFERQGHITFGSFNHRRKVNDAVIALWANVLNAVPGSRLVLKAQAFIEISSCEALAHKFATYGISSQRLDLLPAVRSHVDHLAEYAKVDIALDTFPYNGTLTTSEALWMGVPVVTLVGITHRSRVSLSILTNVGLRELAAESPEEFVSRARQLAHDREKLRRLRFELRSLMQASPLMDGTGFVRSLETEYRTMWRAWCTNPPVGSSG